MAESSSIALSQSPREQQLASVPVSTCPLSLDLPAQRARITTHMADWKFGRRHVGCVDCEREFLEREPHLSLLTVQELEIGREDVCRQCFDKRELAEGTVWWRTKHSVVEKKGVQLDLESIHALFDALEPREEQGWRELRYLLCLILMRKRRLKVLGVKRIDDAEVFVVRKPRTQDERIVFVHDFTPERQEELRETLHAIFEGAELDELDPDGARNTAEDAVAEDVTEEGAAAEAVTAAGGPESSASPSDSPE